MPCLINHLTMEQFSFMGPIWGLASCEMVSENMSPTIRNKCLLWIFQKKFRASIGVINKAQGEFSSI